MKIENNLKKRITDFYAVEPGTIFEYDDNLYLKLNTPIVSKFGTFNVVNLKSNDLEGLLEGVSCKILNAKLVIEANTILGE